MLTADDVQKWLEEMRAQPGDARQVGSESARERVRSAASGLDGGSQPGRGATVLVLRDPVRSPGPDSVLATLRAVQQPVPQPELLRKPWALPWGASLATGLLSGLVLGVGVVGLAGSPPPWLASVLGAETGPPPAEVASNAEAPVAPASVVEPSPAETALAKPVTREPGPVLLGPTAPADPTASLVGPTVAAVAPREPRLVDLPGNDPRAVLVQADRRPLRRPSASFSVPILDGAPTVLTASAPIGASFRPASPPLALEPGAPVHLVVTASSALVHSRPAPMLASPSHDSPPSSDVTVTAVPAIMTPASPPHRVTLHLSPALPQTAIYDAQAAVTAAGFNLTVTSISRFGTAASEVRFFHPEDVAAADRIAEEMGADARDFSAYRPAPPLGTLEVWLAEED